MRRILDITWKDLRQTIQDWKSAAFLVAAPILFTILMGIMMGGLSNGKAEAKQDSRLQVAVLMLDDGLAKGELPKLIEQSDAIRPAESAGYDLAGLREDVAGGKLAAVVVVPAGYSEDLLAGMEPGLEIIADDSTETGTTAIRALQGMLYRMYAAAATARASAEIALAENAIAPAEKDAFLEDAFRAAVANWKQPGVSLKATSAQTQNISQGAIPSGFAQSSPGNMVTFALAGLIGAANLIVLERKTGTLQRLLTTSLSRMQILAGHFLAMLVLVFAQMVLLGLVGQTVFGLAYFREPFVFLAMAAALTLWIGSMGLLIGVLSKNEEQVSMLAIFPMLVLAGLGGAWMPLEVTGSAFQAIGRLTPTAWAMQGMQNIILRGQGFQGIAMPAIILLGYALVIVAAATWIFLRKTE